jgi:hypothetical protein
MEYKLPIYEISIDEAMHLGVDEIAFVEDPAIQELWVAMNEEIKLAAEDDKMIVTGPALVPDRLIYRVHPKTGQEYYIKFSKEAILKIVSRYFTQNKQINFNLEHNKENDVQGVILESWIVKDPTYDQSVLYGFKNLVPGTWMVAVKVEDKQFWDEYVKTGKVRGFSIEGAFAQSLIEAMANVEMVEPRADETKDEFVSRCIAYHVGQEGMEPDQAAAICYTKWDEQLSEYTLTTEEAELLIKEVMMARDSYRDYPESASNNAKKALEWRDKYPDEIKGGTRIGWTRANQLANREAISEETIARMASFARHRQNAEVDPEKKDKPWTDAGYVAWLIWGGTSGVDWAKRKLEQIRRSQIN